MLELRTGRASVIWKASSLRLFVPCGGVSWICMLYSLKMYMFAWKFQWFVVALLSGVDCGYLDLTGYIYSKWRSNFCLLKENILPKSLIIPKVIGQTLRVDHPELSLLYQACTEDRSLVHRALYDSALSAQQSRILLDEVRSKELGRWFYLHKLQDPFLSKIEDHPVWIWIDKSYFLIYLKHWKFIFWWWITI